MDHIKNLDRKKPYLYTLVTRSKT